MAKYTVIGKTVRNSENGKVIGTFFEEEYAVKVARVLNEEVPPLDPPASTAAEDARVGSRRVKK